MQGKNILPKILIQGYCTQKCVKMPINRAFYPKKPLHNMYFYGMSAKKVVISTLIFAVAALLIPACAPKYGCEVNEETHVDFDKSGKKKRGKSELFPKKMRKKM